MNNPPLPRPGNLWLAALIVIGLVLLAPFTDIQGQLSTGDHGRDLYAFAHAYDGTNSQIPYRDYWWVYGPLMPFYYGLFMKLLGVSIHSVLVGQAVLTFTAGMFLALAVTTITTPAAGLMAAAWFWTGFTDFFFTYNHTGGIVCSMTILFCLLGYLKTERAFYLRGLLCGLLILPFIKLNMGGAAMAAAVSAIVLTKTISKQKFSTEEKRFFLIALVVIPGLVITVHAFLLRGLSWAEIRECFPYSDADQQYVSTPWTAFANYWKHFTQVILKNWPAQIIATTTLMSTLHLAWLIQQRKFETRRSLSLLLSLMASGILFLALQHEYLKSGIGYRFLWGQPVWIAIMFAVLGLSAEHLKKVWRIALWAGFAVVTLFLFSQKLIVAQAIRSENNLFKHPRAQVYVVNNGSWLNTVEATTAQLQKSLRPSERFFALPYDPLYYYLTDRLSPTRQTIFFKHINIPQEQERAIIADLKNKRVNWIVASNRVFSIEAGLGALGRDYCPLISQYLDMNFTAFSTMGEWQKPAGWSWNHGTLILKRKEK